VAWVDQPKVSDGLWICWVDNPTYLPYHFFVHSNIVRHGEPTKSGYFWMGMNILSDGLILYNNAFAASPSKDKIMNAKPIIIGVAGGSGSGKTTVSRALYERFSGHPITIIEQDYYYNDQAHLSPEVRRAQNYDHPDAFDNALLYQQLGQLLERKAVELPQYDYTRDTRAGHTKHQPPVDVIILEGILALYDENIRSLMDIKLFVDTDADLRFIRRLQRDGLERGRSIESVVGQYIEQVRPMHIQFVEPTKRHANIIIPFDERNGVAVDILIAKVGAILQQRIAQTR
jgi:uridine kinase